LRIEDRERIRRRSLTLRIGPAGSAGTPITTSATSIMSIRTVPAAKCEGKVPMAAAVSPARADPTGGMPRVRRLGWDFHIPGEKTITANREADGPRSERLA
jgi:hypothetical protein